MPKRLEAIVDDGWRIPDELWKRVEALLPPTPPQPKGGRPWMPARQAMDALFFVLRTGCQWKALPRALGAPSTVHDRFQAWSEAGVFRRLWQAGLAEYDATVGIDWEWQALDGAMTKAPLGGGKNRCQSDRSGQARHEALAPDGRAWRPRGPRRRQRQSPRHEADRGDAPGVGHRAAGADARGTAASVSG